MHRLGATACADTKAKGLPKCICPKVRENALPSLSVGRLCWLLGAEIYLGKYWCVSQNLKSGNWRSSVIVSWPKIRGWLAAPPPFLSMHWALSNWARENYPKERAISSQASGWALLTCACLRAAASAAMAFAMQRDRQTDRGTDKGRGKEREEGRKEGWEDGGMRRDAAWSTQSNDERAICSLSLSLS